MKYYRYKSTGYDDEYRDHILVVNDLSKIVGYWVPDVDELFDKSDDICYFEWNALRYDDTRGFKQTIEITEDEYNQFIFLKKL